MSRGVLIGLGVGLALFVAGVGLFALLSGDDTTAYQVPSPAMEPTLEVGETISVNPDAYADEAPQIGDIVVFHPPIGSERANQCGAEKPERQPGQACPLPTPEMAETTFIKRVVAGPGDTLRIENGVSIVNGEAPPEEEYIRPCRGIGGCDFPTEITIPEDHCFLLGDNRGASDDSRYWGPVSAESIQGRVDE